jgi:type IV pilus assembly protein PilO
MKPGIRVLLFAVVMIGLLCGSYFLVFLKHDEKKRDKQEQVNRKLKALSDLERATANVKDVDIKIAELRKATEFFESKLPQAKEMDKVLKEVWQLAEENGLKTKTVRTHKAKKMQGYSEQPIEMSLAGDFHGFYEFMLKLEKLPRLTKVTHMNLSKMTEKDGEMQASLTLSIFFEPDTIDSHASAQ